MIADRPISRRTLLGAGIALGAAPLKAMQDDNLFGLEALLDGRGIARIPAGEFLMGSDGGEDEEPVHRVRISHAFELSKCEISQAQWKSVMADPHARPGAVRPTPQGAEVGANPSHFAGPSLPVDSVSWDDIQVFLRRLNARDEAHRYRLPTEAEWEYACKAGVAADAPDQLSATAWYAPNSAEQTQPVGTKKPNAWGLYDMLGNVAEWVQDWYAPNYYATSPRMDPVGPASGSYRVFRGGCWFDKDKYCRAALRRFDFPISRFYNVGFRVVRQSARSGAPL